MRGLADTLPQMLALVADVVRNPTFPEAEVDLIKANTAQQLQAQMASPQFVANKLFRQSLFGSHPYARTGVTPETLPAIDRAALVEYHKTYYRPNHAFLVIVGDAAPETVFSAAEKAFGGWERATVPAAKATPLPALQGRKLVFVQRPNSVQSSISVGNFSIRRDDERWYTLQLSNQIFGAAFDSRLVRNIREEKGYTYSPGSIFQAMAEGGFYRAVADVRNDVTGATIKEIYGEIDKLRAGGPETEELSDAKQYSRGVFLLQNATQKWLRRHGQHREHVRAGEGLPGNLPAPDLAALGRGGEDRRRDAARLAGLGRGHRRRLHECQGPARRLRRHQLRGSHRQADRRAKVTVRIMA